MLGACLDLLLQLLGRNSDGILPCIVRSLSGIDLSDVPERPSPESLNWLCQGVPQFRQLIIDARRDRWRHRPGYEPITL